MSEVGAAPAGREGRADLLAIELSPEALVAVSRPQTATLVRRAPHQQLVSIEHRNAGALFTQQADALLGGEDAGVVELESHPRHGASSQPTCRCWMS